ncbi:MULTISPECIES: class I SAM-dependent methyltransferase [unclassified Carboxylicivirga]|uniref:class I SAM-dependent methyltransferase n=1 Tax=Carboxylicivirga TaxID=1628153 RepID=UPI003D34DBE8
MPHTSSKYHYSSDWIHQLEDERHWQYYHSQQKLINKHLTLKANILELGIGSSFTSNYLKSKGFMVTTMDIDAAKEPDIVGNIVTENPPPQVDTMLAFEVFEHIPYNEFLATLKKLLNSNIKTILLSFPYNEKVWFDIDVRVHVFGRICFQIATRRNRLTTNHHHWEIRYRQHSLQQIKNDMTQCGYRIVDDYRKYSQHFFVLTR